MYSYFFLHIDKKNHLHSTYIFFSSNSRSSITRLSVDDKAQRSKEESERERNLLLHKTIEERKAELESPDVESKPLIKDNTNPDHSSPSIPAKAPGYSPPHLDERTPRKTLTVVNAEGELEEV